MTIFIKRFRHASCFHRVSAGSGIGRLLAKRFADRSCRLVLWDINKEANEETAAEVQRFGITVKTYTVDLSDAKQIYQAAEKVGFTVLWIH